MKHVGFEDQAYATSLLQRAGIVVTESALELMLCHLDGVIEANRHINLTRISSVRDGIRLHIVDALLTLPLLLGVPRGALCDIGSGAGFPGVPLAVATDREAVLLDSVAKKSRAVSELIQSCGLQDLISTSSERAEVHAIEQRARYSVVLARAVAPLPSIVELAAPLLRDDGVFVALKGRPSEDELRSGDKAAKLVGLSPSQVVRTQLPDGGESRTLVLYRKAGVSSVKLPRRTGLAQTRPLA